MPRTSDYQDDEDFSSMYAETVRHGMMFTAIERRKEGRADEMAMVILSTEDARAFAEEILALLEG